MMVQRHTKLGRILTWVVCLLISASFVHAADLKTMRQASALDTRLQQPRAETMIFDCIVLRPIGLLGTALGTVAFVVSLPFSLPTKSADEAAQKLVVDPARFTFARPLGQVEGFVPSP